MKHSLLPFATALLALSLGGCLASGQVHSSASVQSSASVTMPELIEINPGVQVIADYDEPIFYSSNYYWRSDGAVWYRSSNYTSGWVRVETAPAVIMQIERPSAYVHYHGQVEAAARASAAEKHDGEGKEDRKHDHEERKEDHEDKGHKGH